MGKKSRQKARAGGDGPRTPGAVGPRQPCPCGSGRRYKACHGAADGGVDVYVVRTFEGLPGECDLVALREFVPAALAGLRLRDDAFDGAAAGIDVVATTLLPGLAPAMKRPEGEVRFALQVTHQSGDPSRDLAAAVELGLRAEPGESVQMSGLVDTTTRLQAVVDPDQALDVDVRSGFEFWFDDADPQDPAVAATLEQVNGQVHPTSRLAAVDAAYWTSVGTKEHLRWVMPHDEDTMLDALARLRAAGADRLGADMRLVGSFRAHGLVVPVWDLPVGTGAGALEEPAAEFGRRLDEALAEDTALTTEQRSARNGLANRQLTIR